MRRRNRAAVEQSTDTVSLCGVRGEKRAGREGNEEEEEDEDGGEEEEEDGEAGGGGPSHHAAAADDLVDSREGVEARTRGRGREQRNGDTGPRSNDDHVVLRNSREVQACRVSQSLSDVINFFCCCCCLVLCLQIFCGDSQNIFGKDHHGVALPFFLRILSGTRGSSLMWRSHTAT